MKWLILVLILVAGCAAEPDVIEPSKCQYPEIEYEGMCCKDINENKICDNIEFEKEIEELEKKEYEEAAQRARETVNKSGEFKRTVMDDVLDKAKKVENYTFIYKGDVIEVYANKTIRRLIADKVIDREGKKYIINTVRLLPQKRSIGYCEPPEDETLSSPCDDIFDMEFNVAYEEYDVRLPIYWLYRVEHRKPNQILENQQMGKRTTTLYRIKISDDDLNLWVDSALSMPVKVEHWKGNRLLEKEEYFELKKI